jgi:uncharacterized protein (TIGR00290 family)
VLRQRSDVEIAGLMTTVNELYQRVAIHAVRLELLQRQAEAVGLPLQVIDLPSPCTNSQYETAMKEFVGHSQQQGIECMAFGDLFLADIKEYREAKLSGTGITPLFPLWLTPTNELAKEMISSGLRAVVTCVDPRHLPASFAGRAFDEEFLFTLPERVDPCGERGEFHTFAFDGPMFIRPVAIEVGEIVEREGFVYADLLPGSDAALANAGFSTGA